MIFAFCITSLIDKYTFKTILMRNKFQSVVAFLLVSGFSWISISQLRFKSNSLLNIGQFLICCLKIFVPSKECNMKIFWKKKNRRSLISVFFSLRVMFFKYWVYIINLTNIHSWWRIVILNLCLKIT